VVIEHNLEVIKTADWLIDWGSEGGDRGGEIVVGTPEAVANHPHSHAGRFLRPVLLRETEPVGTVLMKG
jgi:excinuclease ABC subunit A